MYVPKTVHATCYNWLNKRRLIMESLVPKKLLILRILDILTDYSDCEHRLRQKDIINLLRSQYGIDCERKAIARNIEFLQYAGYDIISDSNGAYISTRKFEPGELRLLIDSVVSNKNVCSTYTKDLVERLTVEGGRHFKNHTKHVINLDDWQKVEDKNFFLKIETLCEAIEKRKKIQFHYLTYSIEKKLVKRREDKYLASPYQLFMKNGHYYLACSFNNHNNLAFLRVDKIEGIENSNEPIFPLSEIKGCENGLNLGLLSNRLPYLYYDNPVKVVFQTTQYVSSMIDMVIDWFGKDVRIQKIENNLKFTVYASIESIKFWLLQFGKYVKVLSPQALCDAIKNDIDEMKNLYNSGEIL